MHETISIWGSSTGNESDNASTDIYYQLHEADRLHLLIKHYHSAQVSPQELSLLYRKCRSSSSTPTVSHTVLYIHACSYSQREHLQIYRSRHHTPR